MQKPRAPEYLRELRTRWNYHAERYPKPSNPQPQAGDLPSESAIARIALPGILNQQLVALGRIVPVDDRRVIEAFLSEVSQPGRWPSLDPLAKSIGLIHLSSELLERASPHIEISCARPMYIADATSEVCSCLDAVIAWLSSPDPVVTLQRELRRYWLAHFSLLESIHYLGYERVTRSCPSIIKLRHIAATFNLSIKPIPNPIAHPAEFDITLPAFVPLARLQIERMKEEHARSIAMLRATCQQEAAEVDPYQTGIISLDAAPEPVLDEKDFSILSALPSDMTAVKIIDLAIISDMDRGTCAGRLELLLQLGLITQRSPRGGVAITVKGRDRLSAHSTMIPR